MWLPGAVFATELSLAVGQHRLAPRAHPEDLVLWRKACSMLSRLLKCPRRPCAVAGHRCRFSLGQGTPHAPGLGSCRTTIAFRLGCQPSALSLLRPPSPTSVMILGTGLLVTSCCLAPAPTQSDAGSWIPLVKSDFNPVFARSDVQRCL